MMIEPKPKCRGLMKVVDLVSPYIIILSIIGLILEYTPLRVYVVNINKVIDVLFVADFIIRAFSFRFKTYFTKGYGWIDLLAALPGLLVLLDATGFFALFKVMRIGRFFKIIRILRVLRLFSFIRKMKNDSAFIQERLMKIGVAIVIPLIVVIAFVDFFSMEQMLHNRAQDVIHVAALSDTEVPKYDNIVAYGSDEDNLYKVDTKTFTKTTELISEDQVYEYHRDYMTYHIFKINDQVAVLNVEDMMEQHNVIMFILIVGLVGLLLIILFYVGAVFAKDMRSVHLIIDSIDAEDYTLLNNEVDSIEEKEGGLNLKPNEDEIHALVKMTGKLVRKKEASAPASDLDTTDSDDFLPI